MVLGFFRDGDDGGGFEAGWHVTGLQRGVENVCEHWRQLVGAVLQGGWRDRVWTGCFAGVLSLKEPVDVLLLQAESRHYGGGDGGHRGVKVWRSYCAGGGGVSDCGYMVGSDRLKID